MAARDVEEVRDPAVGSVPVVVSVFVTTTSLRLPGGSDGVVAVICVVVDDVDVRRGEAARRSTVAPARKWNPDERDAALPAGRPEPGVDEKHDPLRELRRVAVRVGGRRRNRCRRLRA